MKNKISKLTWAYVFTLSSVIILAMCAGLTKVVYLQVIFILLMLAVTIAFVLYSENN